MPDRVPPIARAGRFLVTHPEPVLRLLRRTEPVWVEGRRLHRGVQALLSLGEATGQVSDDRTDVARMRAEMRRLARAGSPSRREVHGLDRVIPGPGGDLPVRIYRPFGAAARPPAIVYAHGGGFVTGDLETHDPTCRLLAAESGCVVVAVDYRLAPEHPFPAAVDDVVAGYAWVVDHADELGTEPGHVGVMGDSAGATLTAVLCIEARRLGLPVPRAQCLVYPLVDMAMRFDSYRTCGEGFGLTTEAIGWYRDRYLGDAFDPTDPRVSPLCEPDLAGLPPAIVITAGFDPLRDDGRAYADALGAAGVPVVYRCYDDMIHAFHGMLVVPEAYAAAVDIARWLGDLLR